MGRDRREFDFTLYPKALLTFWSVNCSNFFMFFIRLSTYAHLDVHTHAQLIYIDTQTSWGTGLESGRLGLKPSD